MSNAKRKQPDADGARDEDFVGTFPSLSVPVSPTSHGPVDSAVSGSSSIDNRRQSMSPYNGEGASSDNFTDDDQDKGRAPRHGLARARTQYHQSSALRGLHERQVPFPMLRAEDEAPTSWLIPRVRSVLYDSESLLGMKGTQAGKKTKGKGVRAWYSSYTTIDWLHDDIREQARLRSLRAIGGTRGWWLNRVWDPLQGWLLVVLVGILCGLFAGFISEWTELLAGWKTGYCTADWRLSKPLCCKQTAIQCEHWHTWKSQSLFSGHVIFVAVGTLYTLLASILVVRSATRVTAANHGVSTSVETSVSPTLKIAYYGAGSGIPEVKSILAGFVIHGFLGVRTLMVKTFGLILCCASGIMAGKEGPMVQIAASLGNISTRIFDKYYKNEAKKREIISASAAAAVSTAFGAPLGGVLFSLEEVSYFFPNKTMLRSLTCALVAALVLKAYNPFGTGKLVLFQTSYDLDYHWFEMVPFVVIGIFGGLYGALFCRLNMAVNRMRKSTWVGRYPIAEVLAITLFTLWVSYRNPFTRIGLGELVSSLFQECSVDLETGPYKEKTDDGIEALLCVTGRKLSDYLPLLELLALAIFNRAFFAIITFGLKVPSGLVLPSMSIGAVFGRIVGTYVEYLTKEYAGHSVFAQCPANNSRCVIPGIYALVGAGATLTGATRTTISVVAILMELTGNLIYTLPVLVGVMTARWIADYFTPSGIYDLLLEHAGHPYFDSKTQYIHTRRTAMELMQSDLETICVDYENENTLDLLRAKLHRISERGLADGGFPVVNSRGHLLGWIACAELEYALSRCQSLDQNTVCFFNNPLWQMDYISNNPLSIPHYRTPMEYARHLKKSGKKSGKRNSDSSNDKTTVGLKGKSRDAADKASDADADADPRVKLQRRWKWLHWSLNSNNAGQEESKLLDASSSRPAPSSYQSSEHTVKSENHSPSPSPSRPGSSGKAVSDTEPNDEAALSIKQTANISMPYFHDRPNDFTPFVDQTPLSIATNSPIELVANLLGRLGVSYLAVVEKGVYRGAIFKKAYIGYVKELEEGGYVH